jgi:glutathione S-transferase
MPTVPLLPVFHVEQHSNCLPALYPTWIWQLGTRRRSIYNCVQPLPCVGMPHTMKLYYSPGACSLSPHIVLEETGLPYEAILASTKSHKLQDGTDYYTINPLGYVPFLVMDNGQTLREGPVIVQYLADQAPAKHLIPAAGTLERYRVLEWLNFIGTELHKGFGPLFNPNTPAEYKPAVLAQLRKRFDWVEKELTGKDYLTGSQFCVADAYLFTVSNWAQHVGLDLSDLSQLQAYRQRVGSRPTVQAAMRAEGLIKG